MTTTRSPLPAIVLAAGFSRRHGPLQADPNARRGTACPPAVRAALGRRLAPVLVTVRPDASPELLEAVSGFDARVEIVPAPDAHLGQAESLKAGIRRLVSRFDCPPPGVVVLLGDQPLVGAELVRELTAFYLQKPECAAAPACDGVRGNPVILPAGAFGDTLLLSGDKGARGILAGIRLAPHAYQ